MDSSLRRRHRVSLLGTLVAILAIAACSSPGGGGAGTAGGAGSALATVGGAGAPGGGMANVSGGAIAAPGGSGGTVGGSVGAGGAGGAAGGGGGGAGGGLGQAGTPGMPSPELHFDTTISRDVLERYLARSISFTELLHDDLSAPRDMRGVDPHDNLRLLIESKAKFVGRALMLWGSEQNLATYLARAKPYIEALHQADPDLILQAAAFEIVTKNVASITIPERVLSEFGQPTTPRPFVYEAIVYANGNQLDKWGAGASVPDMSRLEARMWFYYLTTSYIDVGIEAIHFGQVSLMDQNDPGHVGWLDMLGKARAYANQHARRHLVICDAHTPTGGYVENGKLLFDVHAFPLRIAEVAGMPYQGVLKIGYADSLYGRSKGGITPSGWSCDHLPYLVEFDNFGSSNPGSSSKAPFIWGWDEITWFAQQSETDRNNWLRYAWKWLADNEPIAHLEMPGSRVLSPGPGGGPKWYWANSTSDACPAGFNTEATIRQLWGTGP